MTKKALIEETFEFFEMEIEEFEVEAGVRHLDYVSLTWLTKTIKVEIACGDAEAAAKAVVEKFFAELVRQHSEPWSCAGQGTLRLAA